MSRTPKPILAAFLFAGFALINAASAHAKQDQLTSGTPLSAADKKHLLEDNFVLVKTVSAIPPLVQKKILGSGIREGMADAGQPYQSTDVLESKPLPFRRLVFAGTSPGYCVVYCECGGFAPRQEVLLYHLLPGQAVLVWRGDLRGDSPYLTLGQLRDAVSKSKLPKNAK